MRVLVTGATGFVGSHIVAQLKQAGHEVVCAVRDVSFARRIFPDCEVIACDFIRDKVIKKWLPRLHNIDVVINTVGILYHPLAHVTWKLHHYTPKALFLACQEAGVKHIIHISALGVDKASNTYASSKRATEEFLRRSEVAATVIRPSFVYGKGSYAGGSLFRGLSALPLVLPLPMGGRQLFQPIHVEDLARMIAHLATEPAQQNSVLTAVGAQQVSLKHILAKLRQWMGFKAARAVTIPKFLLRLGAWVGNAFPFSALNRDSFAMMQQDNVASAQQWEQLKSRVAFRPRGFDEGLFASPSSVQDRWHARLYLLKPVLQYGLSVMWLLIAVGGSLLVKQLLALGKLQQLGWAVLWQPIVQLPVVAGLFALCLAIGYRLRLIVWLQIVLIVGYTVLASVISPQLWIDPVANLARNVPLLIGLAMFLAIRSDR